MEKSIATPLRECISVLKDRQWHNVYEFHEIYHLSAAEIFLAIDVLMKNSLIEKDGYAVRFKRDLNNKHLAILNSMQKTKRPVVLDAYEPNYLTRSRKRV